MFTSSNNGLADNCPMKFATATSSGAIPVINRRTRLTVSCFLRPDVGVAWSDLVWSPSVFFNGADEFEPHIDGIRLRGTNEASGEECDVIEVSYFKAQRTRHYWLSRKDHLPRRVKEIVRLASQNHVIAEEWFRVEIDERISDETFAWTPPEGSDAWTPPEWEEFRLKPGTEAPDVELALAQGKRQYDKRATITKRQQQRDLDRDTKKFKRR